MGPEHRACNRATAGRNGNGRSSQWATVEKRVPSGRVRCGRCGWLIDQGDDWRSGDAYGPEHVECRGTSAARAAVQAQNLVTQLVGRSGVIAR